MVDRYNLEVYSEGAAGQCGMEIHRDGDYVLYSDYLALKELNTTPTQSEEKVSCSYCPGMGWISADVGQVFECIPCNQTGDA